MKQANERLRFLIFFTNVLYRTMIEGSRDGAVVMSMKNLHIFQQ